MCLSVRFGLTHIGTGGRVWRHVVFALCPAGSDSYLYIVKQITQLNSTSTNNQQINYEQNYLR